MTLKVDASLHVRPGLGEIWEMIFPRIPAETMRDHPAPSL